MRAVKVFGQDNSPATAPISSLADAGLSTTGASGHFCLASAAPAGSAQDRESVSERVAAMTSGKKEASDALDRLAAALVDDVLATSDAEILAEFREDGGDPEQHADEIRALFERSVLASNKSKLQAARAGIARAKASAPSSTPVDMAKARQTLHGVLQMLPEAQRLTLAARKENGLSDADVIGLLEDLRELGVAFPDDGADGSN
jgi:hypothetical protein